MRLLVLTFVMAAIPTFLNGQQQSGRLPLSGTVIDRTGAGVADAGVSLIRHSARQQQRGEGFELVGQARTDAQGSFSFGNVPLRTALEFPLETAVRIEFRVSTAAKERVIESIEFTAPRDNLVVTSVSAKIRVQ
jgi:hypothetical protein